MRKCSSDGLDILSKRVGNVMAETGEVGSSRLWIGSHLLHSSLQQPCVQGMLFSSYKGDS